jgi:hypothetical protein
MLKRASQVEQPDCKDDDNDRDPKRSKEGAQASVAAQGVQAHDHASKLYASVIDFHMSPSESSAMET